MIIVELYFPIGQIGKLIQAKLATLQELNETQTAIL